MPDRRGIEPWKDERTLSWALYDRDLSLKMAGKILGCSQGTVQNWRDKLNVQPNTHTRRNVKPWQDAETVRWCYRKFGTAEKAGEQLGCSRSAVNRQLNRHDLRDEPWKEASTLRDLYLENGLSQDDIAEKFDVTQDTIAYWLEEFGIADHECPTCDESFPSERGVKIHHRNTHGERIGGVLVECATCGQTVRKPPSRVGRADTHYCSMDCHPGGPSGEDNPNWKGGKIEVECDVCGETREAYPNELSDRGIFCSPECWDEWSSEHMVGEDAPAWKGGYTENRDTNWPKLREKALEADDYRCQGCGRHQDDHRAEYGVGLHCHHIRSVTFYKRQGLPPEAADTVDNLVPLCRDCHPEWEGIPLRPTTA